MRGFATGSPAKPVLYRDEVTEYSSDLERYIHQLLDAKRTENGEFFNVTAQELDEAVDQALAFMKEFQPLLRAANKLRRKKPNETMVEPSDEMLEIYRQLREASRERFLVDRRIELLESKIQIAIGESSGMKGVASWKWADCWRMDIKRFKKERGSLYEELYDTRSTNAIQVPANFFLIGLISLSRSITRARCNLAYIALVPIPVRSIERSGLIVD